ncbi:inositol monophosphatase family protein [soil metagenome]
MIDLESVCKDAIAIVKQAGDFIRQQRKSFTQERVEYKGFNDLVSYVDKTAEEILVKGLKPLIQDAGFITEENTITILDKDYQWIIDPLDGTTNFVHGLPCYCVSVGLTHQGKLVLGIIYEINQDECFYGWKGGGVWLNNVKTNVSSIKSLKQSLLATGFPYTNYTRLGPYMDVFDYCMRNTHGLRRLGSAAVDLAYVACGRIEGFYEYGLNAWDVAAGAFLVQEAGGKVGDFNGEENFLFGKEIIACNAGVYDEFLEVVKEKFAEAK